MKRMQFFILFDIWKRHMKGSLWQPLSRVYRVQFRAFGIRYDDEVIQMMRLQSI